MWVCKLGAFMRHLCVMTVLLALVGCARAPTPEPTRSPEQIATRLAQIPTAAISTSAPRRITASSTVAPTRVATITPPPDTLQQKSVNDGPETGDRLKDYVVREGDTLSSIAFSFNISIASIQLANNLGASQIIQVGQNLTIPGNKRFPDENIFWFVTVVDPGDTLTGISARYGVSVDDLMRVNQLSDASAIRIGQSLIVPVTAPTQAPSTGGPISEDTLPVEPTPLPVQSLAVALEVVELQPLATDAPVIASGKAPANKVPADKAPDETAKRTASFEPSTGDDIEGMRQTLLAAYNQARIEGGMAPLAGSWLLQQAAQGHGEDCAQRGYGSHVGSDGADTRTRTQRTGYAGKYIGENWAWARSAEQAFSMWFDQEAPTGPHRANIMSSHYAEVGFGIVPAHGGYYFIADFGAPY